MKVIVTGGAGFIGSAVCRHMVRDCGDSVVNIDKLTYAADLRSLDEISAAPTYAFIQADILDAAAMGAVLREHQPDAILHLAAESHVDRSITGSAAFITTNVLGVHTLLEAALDYWRGLPPARADAFRFLHVSTDEVFGSLGETGRFSEATPYDPRSPYAASKAAADHLVRAWGHTYGLPVLISNGCNTYGPYHFPDKLIPLMILNGLQGRPLPVYGDGGQVRDWLFVDDHARALRLILARGRPGQTYAVGAGQERSNLQVVEAICDRLDDLTQPLAGGPRRGLIRFVADRPGHDRRYALDAGKLQRELGWRAEHDFETGLDQTLSWYLAHPDWWGSLRQRYDGERLGLVDAPGASASP